MKRLSSANRFARRAAILPLAVALAAACEDQDVTTPPLAPLATAAAQPTVIAGQGRIEPFVDQYRILLGDPNNGGAAGEQPAGRREINWDGVPPAATNTDNFSPTAFQGRGAIFSTPGTGLRVSDNNFADVEPTYGSQFRFFSPVRTFAAVGSNVMDVDFVVAGTSVPALVSGFGAVFSDVDRDFSSSIEYFDADGNSLGRFYVPNRNPNNDRGLSFLGVDFGDAVVARVRITSGDAALGAGVLDRSNGGTADVAVLDDFFYGEPRAFIIP